MGWPLGSICAQAAHAAVAAVWMYKDHAVTVGEGKEKHSRRCRRDCDENPTPPGCVEDSTVRSRQSGHIVSSRLGDSPRRVRARVLEA